MKTSNLTKDSENREFEFWIRFWFANRLDELKNLDISESHNIFDTYRFLLIVDALKCAQLALRFDDFMNLCAYWATVSESVLKVDVSESLHLTFRSEQNSQTE